MSDLRGVMDRGRREAPPGDEAFNRLLERRHRRRRNGRILSASVALAVTGALVAGGLLVLNHRGTQGPAGGGDTQQSGHSNDQSNPPAGANLVAGPGQYYYWDFVIVVPSGQAHFTYWISPAGTGRIVTSSTTPDYGVPPSAKLEMGKFPQGDDLSGLSTDPSVLLGQLEERSAPNGQSPRPDVTPRPGQDARTGAMVSAVEDLLSEMAPHSSPELRVALYGVLRGLPTVQDLGSMDDPAGRPAVALAVTVERYTKTFWFDPHTHLFLAEEESVADDATAQEGDADYYPTYLIVGSGGIVDSDSATPTGDQRFFPAADHLPAS